MGGNPRAGSSPASAIEFWLLQQIRFHDSGLRELLFKLPVRPMSQVVPTNVLEQAAQLENRVAKARALEVTLTQEYLQTKRIARAARLRYSYRRLQQWVRIPAKVYSLWPVGILIVAPLFLGQLVVMVAALFMGVGWPAFLMGFVAAAVTALVLGNIFWGTSDSELHLQVEQSRLGLRKSQEALNRFHAEVEEVKNSLLADTQLLRSLRQSLNWIQEELLRKNWKAMRDSEWEHFLADVFRAIGWEAFVMGKSGDQGVDLIVTQGDRRYAIQAKGYHHSVSNKAVQEAVAGMNYHGCTACAVITNSVFTRSAIELAASNCCVLVGEADIPALVRGQLFPFEVQG